MKLRTPTTILFAMIALVASPTRAQDAEPVVQGTRVEASLDDVTDILSAVQASGGERRMLIGITSRPLDPVVASHLGLEDDAAFVISSTNEGMPAASAGLEVNDIVTAIDGESPASIEALRKALTGKKTGDRLKLSGIRRGKPFDVSIELDDRYQVTIGGGAGRGQAIVGGRQPFGGTAGARRTPGSQQSGAFGASRSVQGQRAGGGSAQGGGYRRSGVVSGQRVGGISAGGGQGGGVVSGQRVGGISAGGGQGGGVVSGQRVGGISGGGGQGGGVVSGQRVGGVSGGYSRSNESRDYAMQLAQIRAQMQAMEDRTKAASAQLDRARAYLQSQSSQLESARATYEQALELQQSSGANDTLARGALDQSREAFAKALKSIDEARGQYQKRSGAGSFEFMPGRDGRSSVVFGSRQGQGTAGRGSVAGGGYRRTTGSGSDIEVRRRLDRMDERLSRLESLLEQLVEGSRRERRR